MSVYDTPKIIADRKKIKAALEADPQAPDDPALRLAREITDWLLPGDIMVDGEFVSNDLRGFVRTMAFNAALAGIRRASEMGADCADQWARRNGSSIGNALRSFEHLKG